MSMRTIRSGKIPPVSESLVRLLSIQRKHLFEKIPLIGFAVQGNIATFLLKNPTLHFSLLHHINRCKSDENFLKNP